MAMGKRPTPRQAPPMWVGAQDLSTSREHPFYEQLNLILVAAGFAASAEGLGAVFHKPGLAKSRNQRHV